MIAGGPDVPLGEPGLFASERWLGAKEKRFRFGLLPHRSELKHSAVRPLLEVLEGSILIDVTDPDVAGTLKRLSSCEPIISSSLHGLVLAEAYGIPSLFWNPQDEAHEWKYRDYFEGVRREDYSAFAGEEIFGAACAGGCDTMPFSLLDAQFPRSRPNRSARRRPTGSRGKPLDHLSQPTRIRHQGMPMSQDLLLGPTQPRAALICCMRNEGMFVVEWVAHHRAAGFDPITVYTNNCTDGSDRLLARLQDLGVLRHVDHQPPQGTSPQLNATRLALADPLIRSAEWLLHIDADEFLDVSIGDGTVDELLDSVGENADVIALLWKLFGDNGLREWNGGSVMQQFTRSQGQPMRRTVNHKSIFRPKLFGRCTDHMPKDPLVAEFRVVNSAGQMMPNASVRKPSKSRYKAKFHQLTFANACLNHYAVKSPDLFLMKNDRGDGHGAQHSRYRLNSRLHRRYNRNEIEDRAILRHWPRVVSLMEEMRSDPLVRKFEAQALETYLARRAQVLTPEQIARWTATGEDSAG